MAIDLAGKKLNSPRQLAPDSVIGGSAGTGTLISGSPAYSSSILQGSSPSSPEHPEFVAHTVSPYEGVTVFRGIIWSLALEGAVAGIGFALWQIWKMIE